MIVCKVSNKDLIKVKPLNLHNLKILNVRLKKVRIISFIACNNKRRIFLKL